MAAIPMLTVLEKLIFDFHKNKSVKRLLLRLLQDDSMQATYEWSIVKKNPKNLVI